MSNNENNNEGWKRPKGVFGQTYYFKEIGDYIEGTLISKKPGTGKFGSIAYNILAEEELYTVWGCDNLDRQMEEIPESSLVRITYQGKETNPNTGRRFKKFGVLYKLVKERINVPTEEEDIPS